MAEQTSYVQAYQYGVKMLSEAGIADAETDAFYLLSHVTGMTKAAYLLHVKDWISPQTMEAYNRCLSRRMKHEPCQYITGFTEFMGLKFLVTPDVLVPRQDTETLAETAVSCIREMNTAADGNDPFTVLDLCTGSGALAVSLKHYCPEAEVCASDISGKALAVAKQNARENAADIQFRQGDLFEAWKEERFDLIVSNPPYVTETEYQALMPEVKDFEPAQALLAGAEGLDFYRRIAQEAATRLKSGGMLLLEIGCRQAAAVSALLKENGLEEIRVIRDLNGLDRVVTAISPQTE